MSELWGRTRRATRRVLPAALAAVMCVMAAPAAAAAFDQDPVLFVHGIVGSGAQFESQKMRFTSNGYPEAWIDAVDYDSTRAVGDMSQVHAQIDQKIEELKQRTGRAEVDVVGHSLGTRVMHDYLTDGSMADERKANVDRYVNVDGQSENPGVPTLAVWAGRRDEIETMEGAENVTIANQTHVEVCTSAESFVEYFRFLTGRRPAHDIVPERGAVTIAGRTLLFPQNTGTAGVTLEVWQVDDATGTRMGDAPVHTIDVPSSGDFGPVEVQAGTRYEFALLRPGVATLHYYYEPFIRSDHLIRLPYSDAIESAVQRGERHVSGLVIRYKELWGDQGAESDILSFNGTNVCNEAICPISKQVNALFFFDRGMDGESDLSRPDPAFSRLPFITGVDLFVPAARPPDGTVVVSLTSRGQGPPRTLTFPNLPSTIDGVVLQFNDFEPRPPGGPGGGPGGPGGDGAAPPGAGGPAPSPGQCVAPRGRTRGKLLGPARLGRTRAHQRGILAGKRVRTSRHHDDYCTTGGGRLTIGYGGRRGRAVLVLSSDRSFAVRRIRRGTRVRELRRRLRGERRVRTGRATWYLARGRAATFVYRARRGRVVEVGVADRRLTRGARASRRFVRTWQSRR